MSAILNYGFQFKVVDWDDDYTKVQICACNGKFAGSVQAYLGLDTLCEVASQLDGFPKGPQDMRMIELGTFDDCCAGGGARLKFYCANGAGHAYVEATMRTDDYIDDYIREGIRQSVALQMPIQAVAIDVFVKELRQLNAKRISLAHLAADLTRIDH